MKKIVFTVLVLTIGINCGIFAQEIQRLTFEDRRSDGVIVGTVTVNAVFLAWSQQRVSIENNLQVYRERGSQDGIVWSDWQVMSREPTHVPTLRQLYDVLLGEYNRHPRSAVRLNMQGRQAVRIPTIPEGRSSPFWWTEDGKSFNILYEFWVIMP
jgi:hypothetical protein